MDMRRLQMAEAQQQQQMQQQYMGQIFGALSEVGTMFQRQEEIKAGAKAGEKFLSVVGPSIGMTKDKLDQFGYSKMNDQEKYAFNQMALSNFGSMSQSYNFGRGLQQRADQPFINTALDDMTNTASGNRTVTPGSPMPAGADDPANTVPLPEADAPLPAVQGAPGAAPRVPGGRASWDARNRDRQKQGLDPLPYPPGI
jgi:hypothetical protein